jgi:hypothetical protein
VRERSRMINYLIWILFRFSAGLCQHHRVCLWKRERTHILRYWLFIAVRCSVVEVEGRRYFTSVFAHSRRSRTNRLIRALVDTNHEILLPSRVCRGARHKIEPQCLDKCASFLLSQGRRKVNASFIILCGFISRRPRSSPRFRPRFVCDGISEHWFFLVWHVDVWIGLIGRQTRVVNSRREIAIRHRVESFPRRFFLGRGEITFLGVTKMFKLRLFFELAEFSHASGL